ncbi:Protein SABRE, partial [Linderina pennispora]
MRKTIDDHIGGGNSSDARSSVSPATPIPFMQSSPNTLISLSSRQSPLSLFSESTSMINMPQANDNRDQVDLMKRRASSNKTFLNIKITGSTICISFQGKKASNITDLRNFEFHAPTLELRNQVESYYELLMQVKKEYMGVVLQHTGALVREKFRQLHNRKAWSKQSVGPDKAARQLLIDMDRKIEQGMRQDMQQDMQHIANVPLEPESQPSSPPVYSASPGLSAQPAPDYSRSVTGTPIPGVSYPASSEAPSQVSAASGSSQQHYGGDQATDTEDTVSVHSAKGKAPISKYMLLDPRKLMGKRLPSMLPKNLSRADGSRPTAPTSLQPAFPIDSDDKPSKHSAHRVPSVPFVPNAYGMSSTHTFRSMYSQMHIDMVPAAIDTSRKASSPKPGQHHHSASV